MVVIDASAAVQGLLTYAEARRLMTHEVLAIPHLADSEIAQPGTRPPLPHHRPVCLKPRSRRV